MRNTSLFTLLSVLVISVSLSSCAVFEGIFKLGFWAGVSIIVLIIVLVVVGIVKLLK